MSQNIVSSLPMWMNEEMQHYRHFFTPETWIKMHSLNPFHPHSKLIPICLKASPNATIKVKAPEQYFPLVLFITLYKVVLTSESVHKILSVAIEGDSIEKEVVMRIC